MVALDLALKSLAAKSCSIALVGGVSIAFPQIGGYVTSSQQIFSPSGACLPFDAASDGAVPADAVAAIILKPLHAALAAGDRVYAVVEGSAVGTDGSRDKPAFTVPSSTGQAETIKAVMKDAGCTSLGSGPSSDARSSLVYMEMHGSGTSLGDGIEVRGLRKALAELVPSDPLASTPSSSKPHALPARVLNIGSNKGNLGNTEAASGLVSVIKAATALSKGVMPPLRVWTGPNPLCEFGTPVNCGTSNGGEVVVVEPLLEELRLERKHRVGVGSLGYGGTNAYCVLASAKAYE